MLLRISRRAKGARNREPQAKRRAPRHLPASRPDFQSALQKDQALPLLPNTKRASPSRGLICESVDVDEAACASTRLPELPRFQFLRKRTGSGGKMEFIGRAASTGLPILRKDFIFDGSRCGPRPQVSRLPALLLYRAPDAGRGRFARFARKCARIFRHGRGCGGV